MVGSLRGLVGGASAAWLMELSAGDVCSIALFLCRVLGCLLAAFIAFIVLVGDSYLAVA